MEDSSLFHRDSAMARGYDLGSCVFSGSVFIHFDLLRSSVTRCLNLDALDLVIDSASISFSVAPSPVSFFRPVDVELEVRRRSGLRVGFLDRIARGGLYWSAVMIEAAEAGRVQRTWDGAVRGGRSNEVSSGQTTSLKSQQYIWRRMHFSSLNQLHLGRVGL
ncbi:hypothetical protein ACMD2_11463 [Ananas comosus]|uniref:Uncharacterized protein n=1 Tax=Ananas comosus TaxID=4615 RepID=A0A199V5W9_ANACO|nr:hypothetical protein ACMD2_11463 [Ananas comosus]